MEGDPSRVALWEGGESNSGPVLQPPRPSFPLWRAGPPPVKQTFNQLCKTTEVCPVNLFLVSVIVYVISQFAGSVTCSAGAVEIRV